MADLGPAGTVESMGNADRTAARPVSIYPNYRHLQTLLCIVVNALPDVGSVSPKSVLMMEGLVIITSAIIQWLAVPGGYIHTCASLTLIRSVSLPFAALQLLIRSPQLRHASEANLRNSLRQLHRLVSHTEVDRAAVLTAVYKYPWIVDAMASTAVPPPAAADRPTQTAAQDCSSTGAGAASFSTHAAGQGTPVSPATWAQELAAVVLELQQADLAEHQSSGSSSRGLTMSPTFAAAAVRTYIAVNEVKQRVMGAASSFASLLGPASQPHAAAESATDTATTSTGSCSCAAHTTAAASHVSFSPSPPADHPAADDHPPTAVVELMQRLQQQQQQHLLLEQLLAACPHLVVLPPELLLARWNRLLSVVAGCGDAASKLVMHSPYLLVDYNDVEAARLANHPQDLKACYA